MLNTKRKSPETTTFEDTDSNKSPKIEETNQDINIDAIEDSSPSTRMEKVFANLRLRRIIKENHGSPIKQLSFLYNHKYLAAIEGQDLDNFFDQNGSVQRDSTDTFNVLATVGGSELSVYDNNHCGNHLDITSNFDITPPDVQDKVELRTKHQLETLCWIHKEDDIVLVTAGAKGNIHVLSLADSREIRTIKAHDKLIYDLQSHHQHDNLILSTSKDKTVKLWDINDGTCVAVYNTDATICCFHPSGEKFITGNSRGEIRLWDLVKMTNKSEPTTVSEKSSRLLKKMHGNCYIDCIKFVNENQVLSKSTNGRLEYWNLETEKTIRSIKIRTGENSSRFDISLDGLFVCVGSSAGVIFIYNLQTGKMVTELGHKKSTRPIRCCMFTRDCRQVVGAADDGFLLRFDYIEDEILEKWAAWRKKT